jgi:hypothetical protein
MEQEIRNEDVHWIACCLNKDPILGSGVGRLGGRLGIPPVVIEDIRRKVTIHGLETIDFIKYLIYNWISRSEVGKTFDDLLAVLNAENFNNLARELMALIPGRSQLQVPMPVHPANVVPSLVPNPATTTRTRDELDSIYRAWLDAQKIWLLASTGSELLILVHLKAENLINEFESNVIKGQPTPEERLLELYKKIGQLGAFQINKIVQILEAVNKYNVAEKFRAFQTEHDISNH